MKVEKVKLQELKRCYATGVLHGADGDQMLFASEDPGYPCYSYRADETRKKELVWDGPGGTMSIVQIPGRENAFLAVQEFYLKVSPSKAKLVYGHKEKQGWVMDDLLALPYVHRFDIYRVGSINYLVCATIAEEKENKEDWSKAGKIYSGILPDNPLEGIHLSVLKDGLYRNHGYCRGRGNSGYFSSDQGVFHVIAPATPKAQWTCEKVLDGMIGEVALMDVDEDGMDELMTIEPFHGNTAKLYHKTSDGYEEVYRYPYAFDFGHALMGARLADKNCFILGVRRENAELSLIYQENGNYHEQLIEEGVGPANVNVIHGKSVDYLMSANHSANEAAVYLLRK